MRGGVRAGEVEVIRGGVRGGDVVVMRGGVSVREVSDQGCVLPGLRSSRQEVERPPDRKLTDHRFKVGLMSR